MYTLPKFYVLIYQDLNNNCVVYINFHWQINSTKNPYNKFE